jgi:hypothetical protein
MKLKNFFNKLRILCENLFLMRGKFHLNFCEN